MVDNMPNQRFLPSRVSPTLDYAKCTTAELCTFFEERTSATLSKAQLWKIQDDGNHLLIDRLREMDKEQIFPRFLELPPELRLGVYEALLVESEVVEHATVSTLQPAILQTSKQVYVEALPVLYKRNTFRAVIEYAKVESDLPRVFYKVDGCSFMITRPRGHATFHQRLPRLLDRTSLRCHLLGDRVSRGMLRMVTRFTVEFNLVMSGKDESGEYVIHACHAFTILCLSLSGTSKLEELTIKVRPGGSTRDVDVAQILWPLLFLRTNVVVKFEGVSAISAMELESESDDYSMSPRQEASFGRQIAHVRRLCSAEIDGCGWETEGWKYNGMGKVERELYGLNQVDKDFVRLDDILGLSPVWRGIQGEADRVETLLKAKGF